MVAAVVAVELDALAVDQHRQTGLTLVAPLVAAFRAERFLIAGAIAPQVNSEFVEQFAGRSHHMPP